MLESKIEYLVEIVCGVINLFVIDSTLHLVDSFLTLEL